MTVGEEITADHFFAGQYVDVSGTSIGKGFAGAMKRHNFGGLRASHGVSYRIVRMVRLVQCQDPGKVFKGKKMAGHMGAERVTVQNLQIVKTDTERGLIMVKGAVPGAKGGWVRLSDAVKKPQAESAITPAALRSSAAAAAAAAAEAEAAAAAEAAAEADGLLLTMLQRKPRRWKPRLPKPTVPMEAANNENRYSNTGRQEGRDSRSV